MPVEIDLERLDIETRRRPGPDRPLLDPAVRPTQPHRRIPHRHEPHPDGIDPNHEHRRRPDRSRLTIRSATASARIRIHGDLNTPPEFTHLALDLGQGDSRRIDLQRAVVDPDPDDDHSFEIESVDGPIDADLDGSTIDLRASLDAEPGSTTTFTYTVADATNDPDRHVDGTVTVTVIGRPSAPPAPTCIGGESSSVRVQWSTPSANGAGISGYILRVEGAGTGTGDRILGNATTQDVTGLTNGADYRFRVGAVNAAIDETGAEPLF